MAKFNERGQRREVVTRKSHRKSLVTEGVVKLNPSGYRNSGEFAPSGNGLYGVCRVRDALGQRIYVHSLGATNFFFAVSAEKMDFRGSEVGSSLKGTAFLSDAWRRVGTLLRPESSAVVCAGGSSHRS